MQMLIRIIMTMLLASSIGLSNISLADSGHSQGQGAGKGKGHAKTHGQKAWHGNKKIHNKPSKAAMNRASSPKSFKNFSSSDRTTIINYYKNHPVSATGLPPGIAMNLARGKPLPPGIAKRYFPNDLLSVLPTRPGSEYFLIGKDAVLLNSTTGIVTDIISNVLK